MLELRNETPYPSAIVPGLDRFGVETVTTIVKATFALTKRNRALTLSERQLPIVHADVFYGEPGASSIRYEADNSPEKRGTDVVLLGHAYAPHAVPFIDVTLAVGPVHKTTRVFGDRVFQRVLGSFQISDPASFERMPLVYERAFGGVERTVPDDPVWEARNPVGIGISRGTSPHLIEGLRLPNLEDPNHLITSPSDRPPPAGFGFIGRDWLPRAALAGRYDERWQAERMPLLPVDFDERYFNGAHPDLITPEPLRGGESVRLIHAAEWGEVTFQLPSRAPTIELSIRGDVQNFLLVIDTLLIEPDERRVMVTWKRTVPCPRRFLYIDYVRVRSSKEAL